MELRHVTKEDLPKLAELISCEELATRDDICFEHSKLMIDDKDMIVSFVIIRQYSLNEFFNGEIPLYKCDKNSNDYKEGDEFAFREEIEEYFRDNEQYEVVYSYERKDTNKVFEVYTAMRYEGILLWWDNENEYIQPILKEYTGVFNNVISCYIPFYD